MTNAQILVFSPFLKAISSSGKKTVPVVMTFATVEAVRRLQIDKKTKRNGNYA